METSSPPHPAFDLSTELYCQLVYTLTDLLPPPIDDTPQALHVRIRAAIAKIAALLPVNANEADLAAQCIAARAQAEEMLRLLRRHAGDIGLVMRLNAQYGSMVRTSLSVHGRLMRVQALRRKREASGSTVNADAWALHVAEQSMLAVVDADAGAPEAACPAVAPVATPDKAPAAGVEQSTKDTVSETGTNSQDAAFETGLRAASMNQRIANNVSETATNSQAAAFETWLSQQPWNALGSGDTDLREVLRQAMANSGLANSRLPKSPLAVRELPANGRESPRRADRGGYFNGKTAST